MLIAVAAVVVGLVLLALLVRAGAGRRLGGSTHDRFWDFDS